MNVANKFLKIPIFITYNRFIAVLKEMPMSLMAEIIADGIAG